MLAPFYILAIYAVASVIKNRNIKQNPIYKYFLWGLFVKIFGAICVCLIYVYYYNEGGDTLSYHHDGQAMVNLLLQSPMNFFKVWFSAPTPENYNYFNESTGYPIYWNDAQATNVAKLIVPLEIITFKSYLVTSILMAVVSYTGIWKLYRMFCEIHPALYKQFAFAILFVPSVVFWGSGILKDSWTLAAVGWFCYSFYRIFIQRKNVVYHAVLMLISFLILISIKPYIFIALMPGCLIWGSWNKIVSIKNVILKIIFIPFILSIGIGAGAGIWSFVSMNMGQYSSMDKMIQKAQIASLDLKQDYYQGNSFDLGEYDPTLAGVLSKFPEATIAGLFRPFLWEAKNVVMIMSGIENLFLLLFALFCIVKSPINFFSSLFSNPLVLFCLTFAIIFAFSVALSTSNFGALVRLRIPMLPFLVSGLFMIYYSTKKETAPDRRIQSAVS